ncbi:hypothetical protein DL95DRAFT_497060 [Leptodontidium sp. 2 PMI_412]|nr:hypothetical protein DL95DRAFT_497060 [Leptodontidium sp. 2 PMI_412]
MASTALPSQYVSPTEIRTLFSNALSAMYRDEVPLYADLVALISDANEATFARRPQVKAKILETNQLERLHLERHGAIRLGTAEEMFMMARFLKLMGMVPVGYYDLAQAGLPVHATCFRTTDLDSLSQNPFRLFVSLLRLPLVAPNLRSKVAEILSRRQIFHNRVLDLVTLAEMNDGRLNQSEAAELITLGLQTFKWQSSAVVSMAEYAELHSESPLLADIVGFRGPHINHLTPRTLDIDAVQKLMQIRGFPVKDMIEGPPQRNCPILLRQTSFKALEEGVHFPSDRGLVLGSHKARFGEVEERGAALTPKGRKLYDQLMQDCTRRGITSLDEEAYAAVFAAFPDDWETLRKQELAWFRYYIAEEQDLAALRQDSAGMIPNSVEECVEYGWIKYEPLVYEDFLPLSAAGIFASNLGGENANRAKMGTQLGDEFAALEAALQVTVKDEMYTYARLQEESLASCRRVLFVEVRSSDK